MFDIRKEAVLILIGLVGFCGVQWILRYIERKKGLNYKWPLPQPIKKSTTKPQQKCVYCGCIYDLYLNSCPSCAAGIVWQEGDYCIASNLARPQKYLRRNAKVWIIGLFSGYERAEIVCISRGGRRIKKMIATKYLTNFRACFIPPFLRKYNPELMGTKGYMQSKAEELKLKNNVYLKEVR